MQLYEQYRPQSFNEFIGQDKVKRQLEVITSRPQWDRDVFWIQGMSGTGKTSLAWIMAKQVAQELFIKELDGHKCDVEAVDELSHDLCLMASGGSWRVVIVNEAHAMTRRAVQAWLTLLERLPKHTLIIFTTTEDLKAGLFKDFSKPFARRCKMFDFTNQGLAQNMAERAKQIAQAENLDGQPIQRYVRLIQDCKNNLGEALQRIEQAEMMA